MGYTRSYGILYVMFFLISLFFFTGVESAESLQSIPTHWDLAPDSLNWYTKDNVTLINPWNYIHRLGLYKIILNQTASCLSDMEMDTMDNPLWGLPIQHGWQFDTYRLDTFNTSVADDCTDSQETWCISSFSWWANMNYHLSVVPFLGMVHAGYFEDFHDLQLQLPVEHADEVKFCNSVESCLKHSGMSLTAWSAAFDAMKNCKRERKSPSPRNPQWRPDSLDEIIGLVWNAHVHSLLEAEPLFGDEAELMSTPEANFGHSWANVVEFLGATRFLTNLEETAKFQDMLLPKRILKADDVPPNIPDMTETENEALWVMNIVNYINEYSEGKLLALWKRAMCSKEARIHGREILANVATNLWAAFLAFLKLVYNFFFALFLDWD